MLVWETLGAMIGAGLASGREIATFFSAYGPLGYIGAVAAVATIFWLADTPVWSARWPAGLHLSWKAVSSALLITTGSSMLAAAGEIGRLVLPLQAAQWIGKAAAMLIACKLAESGGHGFGWVSAGMMCIYAVTIVAGLVSEPAPAGLVHPVKPMTALLRGVLYGGFNAALLIPGLKGCSAKTRRFTLLCACAILLILLWAGNAVLLRKGVLLEEPMPFLRIMNQFGIIGYALSAGCMYLAILTTLTACLRGLENRAVSIVGIAALSTLGFQTVVDKGYSLLGGLCMLLLIAIKFMNCAGKAFISRADML